MHEKLDQYRPTMEMVSRVRQQLVNAGMNPDAINHGLVEVILAAARKWIATTEDGMTDAAQLLGLEWKKGDPSYTYELRSQFTTEQTLQVEPSNIVFFKGIMAGWRKTLEIEGREVETFAFEPITPSRLVISKRDSKQCDGCSTVSHCVKDARIGHSRAERLLSLCAHCRANHEDLQIRDYSGTDECRNCQNQSCCHKPQKMWP